MNRYIDIYCERLEPGLWAEPINAITNIAFFIAAFFAFQCAQKENALSVQTGILIALLAIIGAGSTLFHTFAQLWAMLSDVLPILTYQIIFIGFYCRYIIALKRRYVAAILGLFFISMAFAMQLPREWLNGSLEYAPALLFLAGLGLWHVKHAAREKWTLLVAAAIFTASLALRSIDMQLCETLPLGTHFAWHILNGAVLYLTTRAFVLNAR